MKPKQTKRKAREFILHIPVYRVMEKTKGVLYDLQEVRVKEVLPRRKGKKI